MTEDQARLVAELNRSAGFAELKKWAHEQRDGYLLALAKQIVADPDSVTSAALREKAAFFRGINTVLNQPFFSAKALKIAIEQSEVTE